MERKHPNFRLIATCVYAIFFAVYFYVGFQPVSNDSYEITGQLDIPAIGLNSPVTTIIAKGKTLTSPQNIIGAYSANPQKTLLIAHSSTVFRNLNKIRLDNQVVYRKQHYRVTDIKTLLKSDIDMQEVLSIPDRPTLILMTCAGTSLDNYDATHRLIVTAEKTEESDIIN